METEKNLKKSKNKIFGWLFVAYPVITIFLPIAVGIILLALGVEAGSEKNGPASTSTLLRLMGVSPSIIYSIGLALLVFGIICPIIIFIAGIYLIKGKKSGIKLSIAGFAIDFIFRFFYVVLSYSNIYTKKVYLSSQSRIIILAIFFLVDMFVIYYFTKRRDSVIE